MRRYGHWKYVFTVSAFAVSENMEQNKSIQTMDTSCVIGVGFAHRPAFETQVEYTGSPSITSSGVLTADIM